LLEVAFNFTTNLQWYAMYLCIEKKTYLFSFCVETVFLYSEEMCLKYWIVTHITNIPISTFLDTVYRYTVKLCYCPQKRSWSCYYRCWDVVI